MTIEGPATRADAYVLRAGADRDGPGFKLGSASSAGLVSILEFTLRPWQSGPDLHRHGDSDEAFYVLDGRLEMQVGDERHVLGAGEFAWVPRGTAHTFANAGPHVARALTVATPGGLERFLAEYADLHSRSGTVDPAMVAALRERHHGSTVGPPITARDAPARRGTDADADE